MRMERIKHHHEVFLKTSGVFSALHGRTVQYYRVLRASSLLLLYIRKTGRYKLHFYVSAKVPRLLSDCGKGCSVVVDFLMFFSFDTPPLRIVLLLWGNRAHLVVCSHQSHPLSIVPPTLMSQLPTRKSSLGRSSRRIGFINELTRLRDCPLGTHTYVHIVSYPQGHRDVTSPDGTTHRELPDGTVEVDHDPARAAGGMRGDVSAAGRGAAPPLTGGGRMHPKLVVAAARASSSSSPSRW